MKMLKRIKLVTLVLPKLYGVRFLHQKRFTFGADVNMRKRVSIRLVKDGSLTIGNHVVIGANAIIHQSIPDNTVVYANSELVQKPI